MTFSPKQYATALYQAISESAPADESKILDTFATVLKENGDLGKLDDIEREFIEESKVVGGERMAEVTSAKKLSQSEEAKIIRELNDYLGHKVELKTKVDARLLGGVVIKVGDELIDGSVKKTLRDLKNQLVK